jgi:uncharacterized coiled-coil protein SlyX
MQGSLEKTGYHLSQLRSRVEDVESRLKDGHGDVPDQIKSLEARLAAQESLISDLLSQLAKLHKKLTALEKPQ